MQCFSAVVLYRETAAQARKGRTCRATLHRAAGATAEWVPRKITDKPDLWYLGQTRPRAVGACNYAGAVSTSK